jgi:hypothetical protein
MCSSEETNIMDHIAFAKVSLEEAKTAMDNDVVQTTITPAPRKDWAKDRESTGTNQQEMAAATFRWLATLPPSVQPRELGHRYPRIANRLAKIWHRPLQCERYLDELMMDMRGNRRGFPPEVAAEIAALKVHFLSSTDTIHYDVWGTRIGGA